MKNEEPPGYQTTREHNNWTLRVLFHGITNKY
jgi:hypothetical protein